jgi:RHS repeat-associated protein
MFHHFAGEPGVGKDCLVRSTDFTYSHEQNPDSDRNPGYTFLRAVTQTGYQRAGAGYQKRSVPPVEFNYTEPVVQDTVEEVGQASLENLPIGVDGAEYQWTDLHGEGIPGILTEQADAWFYKRNLSPINDRAVEFAPLDRVALKPSLSLAAGAQFLDLAGDGEPDMVVFDGPTPGFFEHDEEEGWRPFRPFKSRLNRNTRDPNLKFVDLDGDGHADVLITEDDAIVWHPSLAEDGFGPALRVTNSLDEETGPRLVFADGTQSVYLADLSGDGLTDLVRIRNGEVCYWPNLGYGRFGAKVTMDNSPHFDNPDQFDQQRVRLADIDGSGTTDIIYLHRDGVRLYFNQSGNSWSLPNQLNVFPRVDDLVSIVPTDLLGNGTACLVWSSPLPGDARRPMRYVNLMGGQKPHLLVRTVNNLGAETRIHYAPSTKFSLQDKRDGKPWITRLPFPVHVVERVETFDHISRNRFATHYAYHHGYFDGEEREFRGFGMVEQWDTEQLAALTGNGALPDAANVDVASDVPPVLTRTWFHTGVFLDRERVSRQFEREFYREPGLTDLQVREQLLPDTVLPSGLTLDEEREACRALKGSMLRQEVYALDGTPQQEHPYTVSEQNFSVRLEQPRGLNRHAVFLSHPREAISFHYERNAVDPRIQHSITLEVDSFGNALKEAAIGYGRRQPDLTLPLDADRNQQSRILVTYSEHRVSNPIDDFAVFPDDFRTPMPSETRTYELTGYKPTGLAGRFQSTDFVQPAGSTLTHIFDSEMNYENPPTIGRQRRLIEQVRSLYRKDDLTSLLPVGQLEPLAIPGESYKLAFTPGLIAQVFQRNGVSLMPDPADVLGGQAADRGGYLSSQQLKADGRFLNTDPDDHWWIPSGRMFFSPGSGDTAAQELAHARSHFFLPHRTRDPFHSNAVSTESIVAYDAHKLLMVETRDALGSRVSVDANDYRVLQPRLVSDPNRNQTEVVFDTLGLVAGTAIMGKPLPAAVEGDSLAGFVADLTQAQLDNFHDAADPHTIAPTLLQSATTRIVYDIDRFQRSQLANPLDQTKWRAPYAATLARETHASDPLPSQGLKIQISFSYSDGFGREIQKKIQAEPGQVVAGGPVVNPRWVGSGWTIFNNKGKPVRQYEPFFSTTHHFEFGVQVGVSPILFYDPVERVVATLHPNHTWEKVVVDPWRQITWDVNDTVLVADPKTDADVGDFFARLPDADYLPTWHARMSASADPDERNAAERTEPHANTPAISHFDALGRPFLTIADNGTQGKYETRVELDIEGNQRSVTDSLGRIVMRYDYGIAGPEKDKEAASRIHQSSMEAGERWMLNDVAGKPIRAWDSRGHAFRSVYDALRRPLESYMREGTGPELLVGRTVYGETRPTPDADNLRGKAIQQFDQAGVVTSDAYDFKGNPLRSQRQLAVEYKAALDWSVSVPLEAEIYTRSTRFDALNRPTEVTTPDHNVSRPSYNEANLLERMEANLRGAQQNGQPVWTTFVTNIDYDAKGQRTRIDYGNGARTDYSYDEQTFRLIHLHTTRTGASVCQDLFYTYDPAGNITHIRDDAQQTNYFSGQVVPPHCDYTYDAIYRLITATGREHIGQAGQPQSSWNDEFRVNLPHPGDGQAMRNYTEQYLYDAVGNFEQLVHQAANGNWTRAYAYAEPSLIEPAKQSNRLSRTTVIGVTEPYTHDVHGNMTSLPYLTLMQWDFQDQLSATSRQAVNTGTPETTYYTYDGAGERVRKVTERQNGSRKEERLYLGGFETYHEFDSTGTGIALERETLHIMDDKQRIALVETRTQGLDGSPAQLIRYQLVNHLGSASMELDDTAEVISYEEYTPYGSTAYQAVDQGIKAAAKRYRYTGKERDEESGFYYHGARCYAPWLGRWTSCDPIGIGDGLNVLAYCRSNPLRFTDKHGTQVHEPAASKSQSPSASGMWPIPPAPSHFIPLPQKTGIEIRVSPQGMQTITNYDMMVPTVVSTEYEVTSVKFSMGASAGLKFGKYLEGSFGASAYLAMDKGRSANLGLELSGKVTVLQAPIAGARIYLQTDIGDRKYPISTGISANIANQEASSDWTTKMKTSDKVANPSSEKIPIKKSVTLKEPKADAPTRTDTQKTKNTPTKTGALSKDSWGVKFVVGFEFGVTTKPRIVWGYSTVTVSSGFVRDATYVFSRYDKDMVHLKSPMK